MSCIDDAAPKRGIDIADIERALDALNASSGAVAASLDGRQRHDAGLMKV